MRIKVSGAAQRLAPFLCLLCTLPALPAHLIGIPAVVTHHLKALVWNVLRDRRDQIARAEHLEVAIDLRVHSRVIENRIF